ncbi:hypothetical protein K523DRAFT_334004 [Schizophyllum commune Tattone D]|nr:hypothetical protein K523DRAFT_334004 [Schizophyllum commune Tattone D]
MTQKVNISGVYSSKAIRKRAMKRPRKRGANVTGTSKASRGRDQGSGKQRSTQPFISAFSAARELGWRSHYIHSSMIYSEDNSSSPYAGWEDLQQWISRTERASPFRSSTSSTAVGSPLKATSKTFYQPDRNITDCALDASVEAAAIEEDEDIDADAEGEVDDGEYVTMAVVGLDEDDVDAEGEEDDGEYIAVATFGRDKDGIAQGAAQYYSNTPIPSQNLNAPAAKTSSIADVALDNENGADVDFGASFQYEARDSGHEASGACESFAQALAGDFTSSIFSPWTKEDLQPILDNDTLQAWRADKGDLPQDFAIGDPSESMSMNAPMAEHEDLQGNAHFDVRPVLGEVGNLSAAPSNDHSNMTMELEDYAPTPTTLAATTSTSTNATYDLPEDPAPASTSVPAHAPVMHHPVYECEHLDANGQKCGHPFGVNINRNQSMRDIVKEHIREMHLKPAVATVRNRPLKKIAYAEVNQTRIECRLTWPTMVNAPSTRRLTGACGQMLKYTSMLGHIDKHYGYQSEPRM